jgi:nucleotide-binding universal stress UspA family protein
VFDTIVVPLDGWDDAERALGPAEALAAACGARLLLVTVYAGLDGIQNDEYLHRVQNGLCAPTEVRLVTTGRPGPEVAKIAASLPNALVCMSSAGRQGVDRLVLGSVASEVVRRHMGPVTIVGPRCRPATRSYEQLVVPLDGSLFAADVLPFACTMADRFGLLVHLVSAVSPAFVPQARAAGMEGPEVLEANYVADVAKKLHAEGVKVTWEVLHRDEPAPAIVDYVETLSAPLVALTTHGRAGWTEAVVGSVATDIVHACAAPTFLVKPRPPAR